MSNAIFPVFPGYPAYPIGKVPNWATRMQRSVSGRTLRSSDYVNPIWNFTLIFPGLHDYAFCSFTNVTEFRTIQNFYNNRQGAFDDFLFDDPTDDTAVNQTLIPVPTDTTGTQFQLIRQLAPGGLNEWIIAPNVLSQVRINGSPTGAYTLDPSTGIITFSSAIGSQVITADFTFYFRVYLTDTLDAQQFLHNLWVLKQVKLTSVVL